jgi:hypothetical protein
MCRSDWDRSGRPPHFAGDPLAQLAVEVVEAGRAWRRDDETEHPEGQR